MTCNPTIESCRWTGNNLDEMKAFCGDKLSYDIADAAWKAGVFPPVIQIQVVTNNGEEVVLLGKCVTKDLEGNLCVCNLDKCDNTEGV